MSIVLKYKLILILESAMQWWKIMLIILVTNKGVNKIGDQWPIVWKEDAILDIKEMQNKIICNKCRTPQHIL